MATEVPLFTWLQNFFSRNVAQYSFNQLKKADIWSYGMVLYVLLNPDQCLWQTKVTIIRKTKFFSDKLGLSAEKPSFSNYSAIIWGKTGFF